MTKKTVPLDTLTPKAQMPKNKGTGVAGRLDEVIAAIITVELSQSGFSVNEDYDEALGTITDWLDQYERAKELAHGTAKAL